MREGVRSSANRQALLDMSTAPGRACDMPAAELLALQFAAAQELFDERIEWVSGAWRTSVTRRWMACGKTRP